MNIFIASVIDKTGMLTSEESWHCAKVLRKKAGDAIQLIDGKGNFYEAILELVSDKKCTAKITSGPVLQAKRNYYLHLAIAPTKQIDRIEWMIEKAVEIGIDEISFINCKNSERTVIKTDRINKIVESAVKQSLQAYIPKINELVSFKELINAAIADQKLIGHCYEGEKQNIKQTDFKNRSTLILIGPEGDFAKEEVDLAINNKFKAVSFGQNRLRTETAGLYVCQTASILS
ncbi:MAG: 16S rRNA (uracil(1498)-N(3))-methyltransferase [Bacteroidetes bacterium]|nr:16S rRNA (uracil(1498)-N(3))-methyltransferase [Bacteroidota bacterium]